MAKIFADNYSEVEYFDESNKKSGDVIVSGVLLEMEKAEIEDANLVAGWQSHVDPDPVKEMIWY